MSQQLATPRAKMTEDQVKQLIKNLANTFGYSVRSPILRWPEEYGLEYEQVVFPSMDGVPLEAWFFPGDSDKLVIANHPLWSNRNGFPAHLEPWRQIGAAGGNDFEVNCMNLPVKDKKLFWIEGTARRWDGYNYFPEHPAQMIERFDAHMR
jgi:hypothetical protein